MARRAESGASLSDAATQKPAPCPTATSIATGNARGGRMDLADRDSIQQVGIRATAGLQPVSQAGYPIPVAHHHQLLVRPYHQAQGRTLANSVEELVGALNDGGAEAVGDRRAALKQGPRAGGVAAD